MKVPAGLAVGVCSHTGLVRGGNEDDYLLAACPGPDGPTFVAAIADGMGGSAGGAEASRTALRALAACLCDAGAQRLAGDDAMRRGFAAAGARVFEAATAVPALRDMGTTLTALLLAGGAAAFGHVGDTRLYRVRGARCEPLTSDHSVQQGDGMLTRCIGGGQRECEFDVGPLPVVARDRFVLVTDGVWGVVPPPRFAALIARGEPQQVAEQLVREALAGGGPDNATALVVDVLDPTLAGASIDVELPRHERPEPRAWWPKPVSLRAPVLAWLLLAVALLALAWVGLRWVGVDVGDRLRGWWAG